MNEKIGKRSLNSTIAGSRTISFRSHSGRLWTLQQVHWPAGGNEALATILSPFSVVRSCFVVSLSNSWKKMNCLFLLSSVIFVIIATCALKIGIVTVRILTRILRFSCKSIAYFCFQTKFNQLTFDPNLRWTYFLGAHPPGDQHPSRLNKQPIRDQPLCCECPIHWYFLVDNRSIVIWRS